MSSRTIFITAFKDIIRRNILDTDFWPELMARKGDTKVVLVVDTDKVEYFKERFGGENIFVEGYKYDKEPREIYKKIILFLVRNGIYSRSTTYQRWRAYKKLGASLPITLFKHALAFSLGRFSWYQNFVRTLLLHTEQPQETRDLFDKYNPDLVLALSLLDTEADAPIAIEARKRGIRVVGMVRSWDNLNHHIMLPFVPDKFIFQNKWLKYAAQRFQGIDTNKIENTIVGLPHYDVYKNPEKFLMERNDFFLSVGLDPQKKLIFFGGSEYYYSEVHTLRFLDKAITEGRIKGPVQIIFRIHPSSCFKLEDYGFATLPNVVVDKAFAPSEKVKFTDTNKFLNLIYHSDVTINSGSTLSIDAAALNSRPAIALECDDPGLNLSYWESVKRFNDYFDHQIRLIETGGISHPRTYDELVKNINAYLDNPNLDKEGRQRVLDEFVEPYDGRAGKRLASIVVEELS